MKSRNLKLLVCLSLLLSISQAYSFDSGSTGSDGALAPVANTNVVLPANGILNYTTLNIPAGITVTFVPNNANTPAYILVQGDAVIDGDIDVSGLDANEIGTPPPGGFAGGQPLISRGGTGFGPGGSQGGISNSGGTGGSYAQFGFQGGNQSSASRGAIYGSTTLQPLLGGSGGGATVIQTSVDPAKGGSGGGAILLAVSGTLTLNGSIQAQGGDGGINTSNILGSGGGSGGAVRVIATELVGV